MFQKTYTYNHLTIKLTQKFSEYWVNMGFYGLKWKNIGIFYVSQVIFQ